MEEYIEEMREFIKYVWDDLPTRGDDWEQTVADLEFDVLELNGCIPTINHDYDLADQVARTIIYNEYSEEVK